MSAVVAGRWRTRLAVLETARASWVPGIRDVIDHGKTGYLPLPR